MELTKLILSYQLIFFKDKILEHSGYLVTRRILSKASAIDFYVAVIFATAFYSKLFTNMVILRHVRTTD